MITNIERINRDRFEEILVLINQECYSINKEDNLKTCKDCPYYTACFALNRIEIEFFVKDKANETETPNEKDVTTDGYIIGGSI